MFRSEERLVTEGLSRDILSLLVCLAGEGGRTEQDGTCAVGRYADAMRPLSGRSISAWRALYLALQPYVATCGQPLYADECRLAGLSRFCERKASMS